MKRFMKPPDPYRYVDGSVWHPHFAWLPVWVGYQYEWLRWVWKRHMHIEREHRMTHDFMSRRGLG